MNTHSNDANHEIDANDEPRVVKPRVVKPRVVKPKVVKPKIVKPKSVKPKSVKPINVKPKVVKPKSVKQKSVIVEDIMQKSVKFKLDDVKLDDVKLDDVKLDDVKLTDDDMMDNIDNNNPMDNIDNNKLVNIIDDNRRVNNMDGTDHMMITVNGLLLNKKNLTAIQLRTIKKELMVKPKLNLNYTDDVEPYPMYIENIEKGTICVPRFYGIQKFGQPLIDHMDTCITKSNMKFMKNLREVQIPIAESCLNDLKTKGGGIISLHCGAGKTVLALYLACMLGVKTLVVVHKTFLQNQWLERIKEFTDASIGTIRQKKVDVENKDIVVGMLQSISMIDYDSTIFDKFGCVIFDEAHHCASRVFSKALQKLGSKYVIGLSATPTRADGLTKILHWYMGEIIYKLVKKGDNRVYIKCFNYETVNKLFEEKKGWFNKKMRLSIPKMVTNLCKIKERNTFIIKILNQLRSSYERKVLVLSHRLDHLKILKDGIDKIIKDEMDAGNIDINECKTAYYIGKMKAYELDDAIDADIIFATYAMAEEGLDIDKLNTLVLASPQKKIEQSIGRILRKQIKEGDISPLVIDICDQLSCFKNWADNSRMKYYTKKKYTIDEYITWHDDVINAKEYLYNKKIITQTQFNDPNLDVNKEYMIHLYGLEHYELLKDQLLMDQLELNEGGLENETNLYVENNIGKHMIKQELKDILNVLNVKTTDESENIVIDDYKLIDNPLDEKDNDEKDNDENDDEDDIFKYAKLTISI
jgi:superfamily II DNA or RNA helicase